MADISKATWTGRTKRTLQYYATRTGMTWTLHEDKTREPLDVMKKAWGRELDVVTMMGMLPTPLKRDWYRFNQSTEVVDVGRRIKDARALVYELEHEITLFNRCKKDARQSNIENVRAFYSRERRAVLWKRHHDAVLNFGRDPFQLMADHDWCDELCRAEVDSVPTAEEDPPGEKLLEKLREAEERLVNQQQVFQFVTDGWSQSSPTKVVMALLKQASFKPALGRLRGQIDQIKKTLDAQAELARRCTPPALDQESTLSTPTEADANRS